LTFAWEAPIRARYIFNTAGSTFDTVLYALANDCDGAELICRDNTGGSTSSRFARNLEAGDRLILVVDGAGTASGAYRLNIIPSEVGYCSDGLDNDFDGQTDCDDTQCERLPMCCVPVAEICGNGSDDDCDRLVDCADPNCASSPLCCTPSPENCTNAADEDCDGLIDCVDPDCSADPAC
jgi:hypothetical protein